jgi:hypothetical protein
VHLSPAGPLPMRAHARTPVAVQRTRTRHARTHACMRAPPQDARANGSLGTAPVPCSVHVRTSAATPSYASRPTQAGRFAARSGTRWQVRPGEMDIVVLRYFAKTDETLGRPDAESQSVS